MPRGDVRLKLPPATRGLRTDLPSLEIPEGYLEFGENVLCRDGVLLARPGFSPVVATAPSSSRVMGMLYYGDHTQTNRLVIGTRLGLHLYTGTTWSDITGTALTGGVDNQVRFTVFPLANATRLLAVNDKDAPQVYTGSGSFGALGGSPPIARCVTTAFQRVVLGNVTVGGTRRGSELWISGFQDTTIWSSSTVANLTDTGDTIVEVRALNAQAFGIYKDRSQWLGIGAGNLFPFVFELRDQQPGPVSPASVVQAEGVHYYMGQDGGIYRFDGNRCMQIGDAIRRTVQSRMRWADMGRAHGFFDSLNREVWWFYPSTEFSDAFSGVVYRLASLEGDMPAALSAQTFALSLSASTSWNSMASTTWDALTGTWDTLDSIAPTWDSFLSVGRPGGVLGQIDGQVHSLGTASGDDGSAFAATWDTPFRTYAGEGENIRVDAVESLFARLVASRTLEIVLLKSDTVGDSGTAVPAQSFDLGTGSSTKLRATYQDQQARYIRVRHRIPQAQGGEEYRGSILYLYRRGES